MSLALYFIHQLRQLHATVHPVVGAAVCAGVVDFAALGVDQAGQGRQAPGFAAVGDFAWAGYDGGDSWVFDEADGRALFDALFIKAKALVLLVRGGNGFERIGFAGGSSWLGVNLRAIKGEQQPLNKILIERKELAPANAVLAKDFVQELLLLVVIIYLNGNQPLQPSDIRIAVGFEVLHACLEAVGAGLANLDQAINGTGHNINYSARLGHGFIVADYGVGEQYSR